MTGSEAGEQGEGRECKWQREKQGKGGAVKEAGVAEGVAALEEGTAKGPESQHRGDGSQDGA